LQNLRSFTTSWSARAANRNIFVKSKQPSVSLIHCKLFIKIPLQLQCRCWFKVYRSAAGREALTLIISGRNRPNE
jgi:hypothetical protein